MVGRVAAGLSGRRSCRALCFCCMRPILRHLVAQWWSDPDYGHGFFVPLFSGYVLWRLRERWMKSEIKPSNFGLLVMLGAIGLLFVGSLGAELFTSRFSLLVLLAGMILFLAGWKFLRAVSFPLAFLIFMIPLPAIIYNQITFPLQLLASRFATFWLELVHVPVLRDGNVLVLSNYSLEVVEACSGIRSLMTLISLAVIYGYFAEPRRWVRYLLVILMVPDRDCEQRDSHHGSWRDGSPIRSCRRRGVLARILRLGDFRGCSRFAPCLSLDPAARRKSAKRSGACLRDQDRSACGLRLGILLCAFVLLQTMSHGEAVVARQPLHDLPYTLGAWTGEEQPLQEEVVQAVGVSDYTNRIYAQPAGTPVQLYVGYYASQRTGDTIHSPKNCLPGSGWDPIRSGYATIFIPGGRKIVVNEYVIQQDQNKQLVFYWYQGRGRVIASEYVGQVLDGGGRYLSQSHRWRFGPPGHADERRRGQSARSPGEFHANSVSIFGRIDTQVSLADLGGTKHATNNAGGLRLATALISAALLLCSCARNPQVAKAKYLAEGKNYMKKGQFGDASIEFRNALRLDPRFVDAYYELAQADLAQHNWNAAYASLEKAIGLDPTRLDARLDRGRLYLAARQFSNAEDEANFILKQQSDDVGAYQLLGAALIGRAETRQSARSVCESYRVTAERPQRLCEYGVG